MSSDWQKKFSQNYDEMARERRRGPQNPSPGDRQGNILGALGAPQAALKKAVGGATGGDSGEWFPQGDMPIWMYAAGNTAADVLADPLNAVGSGVLGKAAKGIDKATDAAKKYFGEGTDKGMALGSASNYIPNWYGPTDLPEGGPQAMDKALAGIMPNKFETPEAAQEATATLRGFGGWAMQSAKDVIKAVIDPKARALYKEKGITPGSQRHVARALADNEIHKAVAQVQYSSHIGQQAGRKGDVAASVSNIMEKSGVSDYMMYKPGVYADTIRENKLLPKQDGRTTPVSDKDLQKIEEHFGNVWKAPDSKGNTVPFNEAEGTVLLIKAPGNSTYTGDHYNDLRVSKWVTPVFAAFKKHKNKPTVEQLWKEMDKFSKSGKAGWKLDESSDTLEKAQKNGIWITGSKKGRAYTEGGINFLTKVQPNGNVLSVMSDEHNFFENIAETIDNKARKATKGVAKEGATAMKQLDKALPHRLVAATPPMQYNIFNLRDQLKGKKKKIENVKTGKGAVSKEDLENVINEQPSDIGVMLEQEMNRQGANALVGTGLLGASVAQEPNKR